MKIGNHCFPIGERTYIMGILNVTPDSFSDGGRFDQLDAAVVHAGQMLEEGADIIDVGGESTRPGYTKISAEEEIRRVTPVLSALRQNYPGATLSIDSYKSSVCRAALDAGADMLNDIWGFRADPEMADLAAVTGVPCCLMHNRLTPVEQPGDFLPTVLSELEESVRLARQAGVADQNLILDPGIGFGKTYEQNLLLIQKMSLLKETFGLPVLLGLSRKSVIGLTLDVPVDERLEGTLAANVVGIQQGADFVRVHDVQATKRAAVMADRLLRENGWTS